MFTNNDESSANLSQLKQVVQLTDDHYRDYFKKGLEIVPADKMGVFLKLSIILTYWASQRKVLNKDRYDNYLDQQSLQLLIWFFLCFE